MHAATGAFSCRIKDLSLPPAVPEEPACSSSLPWTPGTGSHPPLTEASRAVPVQPEEAHLKAPWSLRAVLAPAQEVRQLKLFTQVLSRAGSHGAASQPQEGALPGLRGLITQRVAGLDLSSPGTHLRRRGRSLHPSATVGTVSGREHTAGNWGRDY